MANKLLNPILSTNYAKALGTYLSHSKEELRDTIFSKDTAPLEMAPHNQPLSILNEPKPLRVFNL